MTVGTYEQPDYTVQTNATAYKIAIDEGTGVLAEVAANFAPHESAVPDMKVVVDAGKLFTSLLIVKAQQTTATLVAPVTNPRIDRIAIDIATGDIVVIAGTEAASPVAPGYSSNHYPVCQFQLATSTTQIFNSLIVDERSLIHKPVNPVVALHTRAGNKQLWSGDDAAGSSSFLAHSAIAVNTFETVGPTGSGATNEWPEMDDLPSNATILLVDITTRLTSSSTSEASLRVFAAQGDLDTPTTHVEDSSVAYAAFDPNAASQVMSFSNRVEIPLGPTNQDFWLGWIQTFLSDRVIAIYYRGFITD